MAATGATGDGMTLSGGPALYDTARLAAELERIGVEALIATRPANVLYLTRYRKGGRAIALVTAAEPEQPVLVVPAADLDFVLEDPQEGVAVRSFGRFYRSRAEGVELDAREALVAALSAAADPDATAPEMVDRALAARGLSRGARVATDASAAPGGAADGTDALRRLRTVKGAEELTRLRRAAEIAERALERSASVASAGTTQAELARAYRVAVVEQDARVRMDNVSIARGSALGNVNQPADTVGAGDVIRYDVGAIVAGYESDLSRCFSLGGGAPDRAHSYHSALVAGQTAALELLRPGIRCDEVHDAAVAAVREAGIPHYERTNVGHGIGIHGDGYDAPLLAPEDSTALETGMVLCVETPYYELGFGGLQVEDMVVITADGFEPLSRLPRTLLDLGEAA